MLFDVARGLARRVPLTKLVDLDYNVRLFLAALMVSALHWAGKKLIVLTGLEFERVATSIFNEMIAKKAGQVLDSRGDRAGELTRENGKFT